MDELLYFTKEIKERRLTNKWYSYVGIINGKSIRLKGYKTWLQIYRVDGIDNSNCMDKNVTEFNHDLLKPFN